MYAYSSVSWPYTHADSQDTGLCIAPARNLAWQQLRARRRGHQPPPRTLLLPTPRHVLSHVQAQSPPPLRHIPTRYRVLDLNVSGLQQCTTKWDIYCTMLLRLVSIVAAGLAAAAVREYAVRGFG